MREAITELSARTTLNKPWYWTDEGDVVTAFPSRSPGLIPPPGSKITRLNNTWVYINEWNSSQGMVIGCYIVNTVNKAVARFIAESHAMLVAIPLEAAKNLRTTDQHPKPN